jgi:Domain of unknown function (DUF4124)
MFKFLIKVIFFVILLFGVNNYANFLVTGKTVDFSFDPPSLPDINFSEVKESISNKFNAVTAEPESESKSADIYLYKWRDEKGVIHYTSEKPTEVIQNLESIKINNQINVVPADSNKISTASQADIQLPSTTLPENIYSPEGIKHLFEQAKSIQNLMNEQFEQQENTINQN